MGDARQPAGHAKPRRRSPPEIRRQQLLEAAARVFNQKGYPSTTMADIAAELGLTKGTLYHYWNSKETLLFEWIGLWMQALCRQVREILASGDPPFEKLRRTVRAQIDMVAANQAQLWPLFQVDDRADHGWRLQVQQQYREFEALFLEAVDRVAPGLDPARRRLVTRLMIGAVNSTAHWFEDGGGLTRDELAAQVALLVCRYTGTPTPAG